MDHQTPIVTHLRDGTRVLLRAARPSDAGALKQGFADLSKHSRLMRFLSPSPALREAALARFVSPDHTRHIALGALVLDGGSDPIPAAIAHAFRAKADSPKAELALTVADAFQGKGLGTLLLGRLLRAAAFQRIQALDALVHPTNRAMAGLMTALGATPVRNSGDRAFVLPVHADPARYPDTRAGNAVRAAWHIPAEPAAA